MALAGALLALSPLTAMIVDASPRASGGDDLLIHPYGQWGGWHGSAQPYGEEPDGRRILYACRQGGPPTVPTIKERASCAVTAARVTAAAPGALQ